MPAHAPLKPVKYDIVAVADKSSHLLLCIVVPCVLHIGISRLHKR